MGRTFKSSLARPVTARSLFARFTLAAILLCLCSNQSLYAATTNASFADIEAFLQNKDYRSAEIQLKQKLAKNPKDQLSLTLYSEMLLDEDRLGEAEDILKQALAITPNPVLSESLSQVQKKLDRYASSQNYAGVEIGKRIEAGDFITAVSIANRAIAAWPDKDIYYQLKGEALYKNNSLEDAELALRIALKINPFNAVAKSYVEEIRTTNQAQTSQELAEWISIAKDKVGDFIVTFLALFAAFLVNSFVAPLTLKLKLNRARRSFEKGDYDDFTDLIEGLLDLENFAPIRSNFQFVLKQKSLTEAQDILNKYVNTLERLPTLLRILEREHERMNETN